MNIDPGEEKVDVVPERAGPAETDQDVKEVTWWRTSWVAARWPIVERMTEGIC